MKNEERIEKIVRKNKNTNKIRIKKIHNEEINQGIFEASSKQIQEKYKKDTRKMQERYKKGEDEMKIDKQG